VLAGVGAGALLFATAAADPANLYPSLSPHEWPQLALLPVLAVALAAAPARLTPPPPTAAPARPPACRGDRVIDFDRVTVTYAGATTPTIRDVTLNVGEGELCLVAGHTGTASRPSSARSTGSCRWSHRQRPASISPPATPAPVTE
jgi:ABC-type multidrug transport system fused ATPase/permease subunit